MGVDRRTHHVDLGAPGSGRGALSRVHRVAETPGWLIGSFCTFASSVARVIVFRAQAKRRLSMLENNNDAGRRDLLLHGLADNGLRRPSALDTTQMEECREGVRRPGLGDSSPRRDR